VLDALRLMMMMMMMVVMVLQTERSHLPVGWALSRAFGWTVLATCSADTGIQYFSK